MRLRKTVEMIPRRVTLERFRNMIVLTLVLIQMSLGKRKWGWGGCRRCLARSHLFCFKYLCPLQLDVFSPHQSYFILGRQMNLSHSITNIDSL